MMRESFFALITLFPLAAGMSPTPASAQQRVVPDTRAQVQLSLSPVVKRAAPAVVNVYGARAVQRPQNPLADDPFFRRFFGGDGFGVPQERVQRSLGSGVIVDPAGLIVTNHHVIENMTEVKVSLADRREYEADIVLRDPRTDLAVLKLRGAPPLPALDIGDSDELEVGDFVLAIGNPFGVGQTVTQGIVSALARTQVGVTDFQSFIQTDAAINPGNSGGALVDMNARLVGINTAIFSRSGGSHGIGFAIPTAMVKLVVDSARGGVKVVRRPWFGGTVQIVNAEVAESLGLERPTGVLVAALHERSPAAEAGLRRGDVIVSIDGVEVGDPDSFGYRFATRSIGATTSLGVVRAGRRLTIAVRLIPPPETRPREAVQLKGRSPFAGATAMNLSPAVADELSLEAGVEGVVFAEIDENSLAAQVGFRKGDIILAVNGERISSSRELERLTSTRQRYWEVTLNRAGQVIRTVLGG